MAKQGKKPPLPPHSVSAERAARLYRLLQLLGTGPQTRAMITRRLRLDVRGFYRDLELLRAAGIAVPLRNRRYTLEGSAANATNRLPFPDPRLTLGEATQLAKGRRMAHRKLKQQLALIVR
jgi:predicted DNA-binding transcriptional regulator YafY